MGPPTSHPRRVINGTDGTPGEVPPAWAGCAAHLTLEVIMDEKIIDTPYNDRYCGNCTHCVKTELRYCLKNHAFVAKNKWCADWNAEDRKSKFEI